MHRADLNVGFLVRIVVLASVAVIGSVWALVRTYTRVRPPMVVPVTTSPADWDARDAGLIPAPELEVERR